MFIPGADLEHGAQYYFQPSRRPSEPLSLFQSKLSACRTSSIIALAAQTMNDRHLLLLRLTYVHRHSQAPHCGVIRTPEFPHVILIAERAKAPFQTVSQPGHDRDTSWRSRQLKATGDFKLIYLLVERVSFPSHR